MLADFYLTEMTNSLDRLCGIARQPEGILNRPVAACPGWSLDELFGHLGSIQRWSAQILIGGAFVEAPAPPAADAAAWFLEGRDAFLEAMAGVDPAASCWNFGPPPRTAGFWLRRQAHEHAIHLVDACQAMNVQLPALGEELMLDGIDEVLTMFAPRQQRRELMPQLDQAVTFHVPGGNSWSLGQGPVKASITAPLQDMYLGLWGRALLAETAGIEGDTALALRVLRGPLTP